MFKRAAGRLSKLPKGGLVLVLVLGCVGCVVFLWQLGSWTPGLSPAEVSARFSSRSLEAIAKNPINAPHKLLQFGLHNLDKSNLALLRLPSVIFAAFFAFCFYKLAAGWFGRAIGGFGALMFLTLPFFVVISRQATPEILFFAPVVLIWLYGKLTKPGRRHAAVWLATLAVTALLCFTPGMIIWIALAFAFCRRTIIRSVASVPAWVSAVGLLLITGALGWLAAAAFMNHSLLRPLFLVPARPEHLIQTVENTGWMALSYPARAAYHSPLIIGRLPLLDIILVVFLIFGVYALNGAARSKLIAFGSMLVFAVLAAGVNNDLTLLAFGLPAAMMIVAAGARYLYVEWRTIFPRNPVPKTFALLLIGLVTAVQISYGIRYSLVAWPGTNSTKAVFVLK